MAYVLSGHSRRLVSGAVEACLVVCSPSPDEMGGWFCLVVVSAYVYSRRGGRFFWLSITFTLACKLWSQLQLDIVAPFMQGTNTTSSDWHNCCSERCFFPGLIILV